jgi:hypothetical protein
VAPAGAPAPATPQLELLSARRYEERGHRQVEGEVKNISNESLENVVAVVTWYTNSNQLLKSDEALIEVNPILPGRTSPFKTVTTPNPALTSYTVTFKRQFGGTIPTKDSRPK